MRDVFQSFIDEIDAARSERDFSNAVLAAGRSFGVTSFAYLNMRNDGRRSVPLWLTSYPRPWIEHYLEEQYLQIDPVLDAVGKSVLPFDWDADNLSPDLTNVQRQMFDEASQAGIHCGLTIPIRQGRGCVASFTFASAEAPAQFRRAVDQDRHIIHLMGIYFHAYATRMLATPHGRPTHPLSPREIECLSWAYRGKTQWEIGRILGIAERTVKFHMENARKKIGAASTLAAVAHAVRDGLIQA